MIRIGHGFDVHKFGGQGPISIGGIKIPYLQGLIAHSDGDVALHALCDAILGALALGDIGHHFPDNDEKYAGIDSRQLLKEVFQHAIIKGYHIGNIDLTIIAEAPKMAPHIDAMRSEIAFLLETEVGNVNIKATTTEKLGSIGRSEGIATHAVVLLLKKSAHE
jgi:2-C-methyl-D-erythritol 2,4-cyclodiphosphate synthase